METIWGNVSKGMEGCDLTIDYNPPAKRKPESPYRRKSPQPATRMLNIHVLKLATTADTTIHERERWFDLS